MNINKNFKGVKIVASAARVAGVSYPFYKNKNVRCQKN